MRAYFLAIVFLLLSLSGVAAAEELPLTLVIDSVASIQKGLEGSVRDAVAYETSRNARLSVTRESKAQYRVGVYLSRFVSRAAIGGREVRCEVSLVVSDAAGAVRVVLRGRAGVVGRMEVARLERAVLRAAVRSALRGMGSETAVL